MANLHEPAHEIPIDFRAPPPSPVASGHRSSLTNDDAITEFLQHSLIVPDLILPDKFFPKNKSLEKPPTIDYAKLYSFHYDEASAAKIVDSIARIGCFQLVNHGISSDFVRSVLAEATGIFQVPPEKRACVTRSPEKPYGFEEAHGDEGDTELREEFVWCRDQGLKLAMEGIWPIGYSNFSKKLETLMKDTERICERILQSLLNSEQKQYVNGNAFDQLGKEVGTVCCFYQQNHSVLDEKWDNHLRYDVFRMLIRGTDYSHAICLHVCDGSSEFHVYSKKGWVSFTPPRDALVVTTGDQMQAWSGSQFKHVTGRPIFKAKKEESISMALLYSPLNIITSDSQCPKENKILLTQQFLAAIFLTLLYQFSVHLYRNV